MTAPVPTLPRRYRWLIRVLLPLVRAAFWWRGRHEPAWREGWAERMGNVATDRERPLWIHAASVGEVNSAQALIAGLNERCQGQLHLSAFTPTGVARLRELVPGGSVALLPLDVPAAVARALETIQPRALVVLETEIWPELFVGCARRGVPVYLVSAKIGAGSVRGYTRGFGRGALAAAVASIAEVGAQTQDDARRFVELGVDPARVRVTGSLKFDLQITAGQRSAAAALQQRFVSAQVLLAASTHAGEESALLAAWSELRRNHPDACLILAPRHPRRVPEVVAACEAQGLVWSLHSQAPASIGAGVYIVDTLGELLQFYLAVDIAFVGGSLVPVGGHNLIEPMAAGCAVMTGPYLESIAKLADQLEAAGGLSRLGSAAAVMAQAQAWWSDEAARAQQCQRAAGVIASGQGALARSLAMLERGGALSSPVR